MTVPFQIFVVFHKRIFDECYNIPEDILKKYFTFVAVNPNIEKEYPTNDKYKIIKEWELPIYDASMQMNGFHENSAIYHIWINNIHKQYTSIGFAQYDMLFDTDFVDFINNNILLNYDHPSIYFYLLAFNYGKCMETARSDYCRSLINKYLELDYTTFFKQPFSKNSIYPLLNTFIIHNSLYESIMLFVSQIYYKYYVDYRHLYSAQSGDIAAVFERIMAFLIGDEYTGIKMPICDRHSNLKHLCY